MDAQIGGNNGNTSGLGKEAVVPEEIKGWSWGAFFVGLDLGII